MKAENALRSHNRCSAHLAHKVLAALAYLRSPLLISNNNEMWSNYSTCFKMLISRIIKWGLGGACISINRVTYGFWASDGLHHEAWYWHNNKFKHYIVFYTLIIVMLSCFQLGCHLLFLQEFFYHRVVSLHNFIN